MTVRANNGQLSYFLIQRTSYAANAGISIKEAVGV